MGEIFNDLNLDAVGLELGLQIALIVVGCLILAVGLVSLVVSMPSSTGRLTVQA